MLKLETPWDDDEDEDVPHRREEDDDTEPDEDDPGEDDDEDDEEPLRTCGSLSWIASCAMARYCSPITATVIVTVTSVCSTIWMGTSPTCLSGPCGMRTCERSTSWPCFSSASTMS